MSVANTKVAKKDQPMLKQMCNCVLLPDSHFAYKCAKVAESRKWAQRAAERAQKKLEWEEKNAKRQQEWKARQEQREQDPDWQRRHECYLRHQEQRDAEAKDKADREAAEAKAQAQLEADQRLERQAQAHQQLLAKLEADREKAQQPRAIYICKQTHCQICAERRKAQKVADEPTARADDWAAPTRADDWAAPTQADDWDAPAPQADPFIKSWAEKPSDDDDASTVAGSEASRVLERRERPERRQRHSGAFLYFNKDEARRLEKVKAALNEIHWLQKQVDAGKKYELDRSQFAKIHGKHAENRIKELEGSEVLRMERAGYKLREKYY